MKKKKIKSLGKIEIVDKSDIFFYLDSFSKITHKIYFYLGLVIVILIFIGYFFGGTFLVLGAPLLSKFLNFFL